MKKLIKMNKVEIFYETLPKFLESRVKNVPVREKILLPGVDHDTDVCHGLITSQKKLQSEDEKLQSEDPTWRKVYERIPYKGWLLIVILIVLLATCIVAIAKGFVWSGLIALLFVIWLVITIVACSEISVEKWFYMFKVMFCIRLCKIPPHDDAMLNPRCIFVRWNKYGALTIQQWMTTHVLPQLLLDLGIKNSNGLTNLIKNSVKSSKYFNEYSFRKDARTWGGVPLWLIWLVVAPVILTTIIVTAYSGKTIGSVIGIIIAFISLGTYLYTLLKSADLKHDNRTNSEILDVICRVHRIIKNESIFITVVTETSVIFNDLSEYFKFHIDVDKIGFHGYDHDHVYFINHLVTRSNQIENNENQVDLLKILLQCISDGGLKQTSTNILSSSKNIQDFLSMLMKTNNGHNNILSSFELLRSLCWGFQLFLLEESDRLRIDIMTHDHSTLTIPSHLMPELNQTMPAFEQLTIDYSDWIFKWGDRISTYKPKSREYLVHNTPLYKAD